MEPQDRFGRSLVYLYRDGAFINGELVGDGFARAKAYPPNVRFKAELKQLETKAKAERRGLWGACADAQPAAGTGFDPNRPAASASAAAFSAAAFSAASLFAFSCSSAALLITKLTV